MLSITTPSTDALSCGTNTVNPDKICASGSQDPAEKKQKKRKRRAREDEEADTTTGAELKEKKKKRKHKDQSQQGAAVQAAIPVVSPTVDTFAAPTRPKKKKDKGKGKATALTEPTDAQIEADSQASAAALLSAIVAASVTNPENTDMNNQQHLFHPGTIPPPGHQFMQYPQMQYGYPAGVFDPNLSQPPSVFAPPGGGGGAFSELAFGSNDDLLRALQDLDMSKIANVLKTLGEAAAAANGPAFAPQLGFMHTQLEQLPQSIVRQSSATSNAILGLTPRQQSHKRVVNMNLASAGQHDNPDHAHLLANKWLTAGKLAELVKEEGLVYKKGKFSVIEEQQLKTAIERYKQDKGLTDDQILETIFSKNEQTKDNAFWSELTAAVPLRPIIAVYHHIRRKYHPMKQQGPWQEDEDIALKQAVADLGQQWEKVCYRVGRMASDCRDRYRNHLVNRDIRVTGHWSKEEEAKLTQIVTDMTVKQGRDIDNDVFWGKVSELMGGSRGRQQCRIKWTDALSKTVKNEGQKPRWSQQDAFILVHKVDSLNVRDDSEIDWKLISDPDWNLWSAHTLQRRWLTLKKGVKGYEDMTHQEIMDILRVKKAQLPPPGPIVPPKKMKERKVTSAPTIHESDPQVAPAATPEAGPSTAPGTSTAQDEESDSFT